MSLNSCYSCQQTISRHISRQYTHTHKGKSRESALFTSQSKYLSRLLGSLWWWRQSWCHINVHSKVGS